MNRIPITIITGYLGAGKTTLLKRIVEQANKRIAIVMNEFGEIAIDSKVIKEKNFDMIELAGGCVCCSLTGEFEAAVKEIIEKTKPEHIVLETTGVAEPDAIVVDVQENLPQVRLDAVVTIADCFAIKQFPSLGHTGRVQIELADLILLNKIDLVKKEDVKQAEELLKQINSRAAIIKTIECNAGIQLLLGVEAGEKKIVKHKKHALERIQSFSLSSKKLIDLNKFREFAQEIPLQVYRAKGFIATREGVYLFNFVAGRSDLEKFREARQTQLVFIGENVNRVRERILSALKKCGVK